MSSTSIEWTDATWNPTVGCSLISPGCENCYAMRMAARLALMGQKRYVGLTRKTGRGRVQWTGVVRFVPEMLRVPLKWKQPKRIFVDSMSDLFHEAVSIDDIASVWAVMILAHWHTFQVLTKRADRMHAVLNDPTFYARVLAAADIIRGHHRQSVMVGISDPILLPPRNVELFVSAENQETADQRIPLLLTTPAAVRGVSAEPLLGAINFKRLPHPIDPSGVERYDALRGHAVWSDGGIGAPNTRIDVVILGGESGPGAREFPVPYARNIIDQCKGTDVKVFFKQMGAKPVDCNDAGFDGGPGEWPSGTETENWQRQPAKRLQGELIRIRLKSRKGNDPNEWPVPLRVRQLPRLAS